jgi:hypothetical protein
MQGVSYMQRLSIRSARSYCSNLRSSMMFPRATLIVFGVNGYFFRKTPLGTNSVSTVHYTYTVTLYYNDEL